jgi:hypothetical protein
MTELTDFAAQLERARKHMATLPRMSEDRLALKQLLYVIAYGSQSPDDLKIALDKLGVPA